MLNPKTVVKPIDFRQKATLAGVVNTIDGNYFVEFGV